MNEQIIDYLHYLTIERGLSQNTRASYQRDLQQYLAFLQKKTSHSVAADRPSDRFVFFAKSARSGKILGDRDSDGL